LLCENNLEYEKILIDFQVPPGILAGQRQIFRERFQTKIRRGNG